MVAGFGGVDTTPQKSQLQWTVEVSARHGRDDAARTYAEVGRREVEDYGDRVEWVGGVRATSQRARNSTRDGNAHSAAGRERGFGPEWYTGLAPPVSFVWKAVALRLWSAMVGAQAPARASQLCVGSAADIRIHTHPKALRCGCAVQRTHVTRLLFSPFPSPTAGLVGERILLTSNYYTCPHARSSRQPVFTPEGRTQGVCFNC